MKKSRTQAAVPQGQDGVNTVLAINPAESSVAVIEEAGVGFDPTTQHLDLTKDEKRRTTALMMAIQAYNNLIIKDAEMYIAISRDAGRDEGPKIRPGTIDAMVDAAWKFDCFISGELEKAALLEQLEQKSAAKDAPDEAALR